MAPPSVTIVGAGLAGLTLGRSLRQQGIPALIYERASSPPRHCYGITLHSSTYRKLLPLLHLDEDAFREKVAVDGHRHGKGRLSSTYSGTNPSDGNSSFRCNQGKLELLLREGQDIRWDHAITEIELLSRSSNVTAAFQNGGIVDNHLLFGCDGVHSMTRQSLSPTTMLKVLPYVVFNGQRRYSYMEYNEKLAPYLVDSVVIQTLKGDARFEISLSEHSTSNVAISYTYSRPAKNGNDLLHKPERPNSGATNIPEEFYTELESLEITDEPFKHCFDAAKIRKDRVLHWLMRSLTPDRDEAQRLARRGVILIGDAAHAMPILGGEGANIAITDGLELAEHIAESGVEDIQPFLSSRFDQWERVVTNSERRLEEMHSLGVES